MNTPRTIAEYLEQLRAALAGADPALIQDALYDAEEHLRAELQEHPGMSQEDMLAKVVGSYGSPEEVADIYRDQEIKIQRALRPPPPPKRHSLIGRFFGVAADARTWGSLFYMLLALATGIIYFTWVVTGISMSAGLAVLIVGIPFIVLFFGTVRGLSLMEGRIVETMLGVRMPRRPPFPVAGRSLMSRIGTMFTDARTWTTMLYMVLMLPLGIIYFTITVTLLSVSIAFTGAPLAWTFGDFDHELANINWGYGWHVPTFGDALVLCVIGVLLLFATLHLVRGIGRMHGLIAKSLLVSRSVN
ncbi:sensor domain-containing protein [Dyella sp. LX-66]|uniref:sensor domain-containing protein n=1 Tax=unclassified Dyella TaxID=2634549 RepID=UPI001BE058D4|nr:MULTISPECIES: sensor domain-containing protein [unclassified Dyella]MBT2118117.1 sensor domain-containing protein [Dyella sp. LX-1]MBT2141024.1 sensor domain-containing protein [Dyella sp. LX-66]